MNTKSANSAMWSTPLWQDLAICLSVANLAFLALWKDAQAYIDSSFLYVRNDSGNLLVLACVAACILILAALLGIPFLVARQRGSNLIYKAASALLAVAVILPLNELRNLAVPALQGADAQLLVVPLFMLPEGFLVVVLYALLVNDDWRLLRGLRAVFLPLAPLFVISAGFYLQQTITARPVSAAGLESPPTPSSNHSGLRVVWVIFDEWDRGISIDHRPIGLAMPEIDRLAVGSVNVSQAFPPAGETVESVPAMLTGRIVSVAEQQGPDHLRMKFEGAEEWVSWKDQPNLFQRLNGLGRRSSLVGWFHPYCRLFGEQLGACAWEAYPVGLQKASIPYLAARRDGLPSAMGFLFQEKFSLMPWSVGILGDDVQERLASEYRGLVRWGTIDNYRSIHRKALEDLADPDTDFLYLHYPIPHPPGIFDGSTGQLSESDATDYAGNLALLDRAVGEIRQVLEETGLWDDTFLFVTSDHPLREEVWNDSAYLLDREKELYGQRFSDHVPLFLKAAGQQLGIQYDEPINTVLLHDLTLAIFRGEIPDAESTVAWLDDNRNRFPARSVPIVQ